MNLATVFLRFPTQESCLDHIERARWNGRPVCPYCQSSRVTRMKDKGRLHCNVCNTTFSATVKTPFHRTHIPLQKCFYACWLFLRSKEKITGRKLGHELEIGKDAACQLVNKLGIALHQPDQRDLLHRLANMEE